MKPSHVQLKNLVLFLIALLIGICISELIVRSFIPIRNVGPSFTVYDPFYGKTLKKSFSTQRITPEFTMSLTTNSGGFRGPEIETTSSRPILFLGDSFTMGYGVNDGEEFPALIRKALSENENKSKIIPVINAGMGDNGNGRSVKFLRTEGKKYNPSLIVLQIHATDFKNNIHERLFKLDPAGELIELDVPSPGMKRMVQTFVESVPGLANLYLIGWLRQMSFSDNASRRNSGSDSSSVNQDQALLEEQLLFRLLEELLTISKEHEYKVLAVLADIPDKRLAMMRKFFAGHNVATVTIPTKLNRPDLYYKTDGHWNTSGHRFAADRIFEAIEEIK